MSKQKPKFKPKLIYAFTIPSPRHEGYIKVGETIVDSLDDMFVEPNSNGLNSAARRRIDQYTKTAGIEYSLLYTESASVWSENEGRVVSIRDKDVHNILIGMGAERADWGYEWFKCTIEELKSAIACAKSRFTEKPKKSPEIVKTNESEDTHQNELPTPPKPILIMTDKLVSAYNEMTKKNGIPDGYGEFNNILEFYNFMKAIKPKGSKDLAYSADCNILRLDGQPLSKETVCFLPNSIGRRLLYMSGYAMTADEFAKLGDRYYYSGQCIAHTTNSEFGEWYAATTEIEKDKRNYNITNQKHFNNLQDAIDWRNEKVCNTIRHLADLYANVLSENVYNVLSKFSTEDLLKLTQIQHYTYNSEMHQTMLKIIKSNNIMDKNFMYKTLGVSIQATA